MDPTRPSHRSAVAHYHYSAPTFHSHSELPPNAKSKAHGKTASSFCIHVGNTLCLYHDRDKLKPGTSISSYLRLLACVIYESLPSSNFAQMCMTLSPLTAKMSLLLYLPNFHLVLSVEWAWITLSTRIMRCLSRIMAWMSFPTSPTGLHLCTLHARIKTLLLFTYSPGWISPTSG